MYGEVLYFEFYSVFSEAVPSKNYIGRQIDVYYIGREMYGEISIR